MSRRVLLICYYFPPLGLGGVGRPLNLFKKLPEHGYECDILTVKPVLYRAYEPELMDRLDQSRIHRSGSYDPQRLMFLLGMRTIKPATIDRGQTITERYFPDSKKGWIGPAVRLGKKLHRQNNYDMFISTSPPISSHLVGLGLAEAVSLPLVADFRDFWTSYRLEDVFADPARLAEGRQLLERIKSTASAITCANGSIAEYLGTGETITNGYDSDFARHWNTSPDSDRFTIGLLGHQVKDKVIEPLIEALAQVQRRTGLDGDRWRLLQVGQVDREWFTGLVQESGLRIDLDLRGPQPREATTQILSASHMFYLGMSEQSGLQSLPGRLFELIASGRPVAAFASDDSEVGRHLAPTGNSFCFGPSTVDSAAIRITELVRSFDDDNFSIDPLSEYARRFSSDAMARKFADVLDGLK